jgi:hypothetical protein
MFSVETTADTPRWLLWGSGLSTTCMNCPHCANKVALFRLREMFEKSPKERYHKPVQAGLFLVVLLVFVVFLQHEQAKVFENRQSDWLRWCSLLLRIS